MGKKKRALIAQHAPKGAKLMRGLPPAKRNKPSQAWPASAGNSNKDNRSSSSHSGAPPTSPPPSKPAPTQQTPIIPFAPEDAILLVGEGDLSFAASLVTHHKCTNVTATVLEKNLAELTAKYPHAATNIAAVEAVEGCRVLYDVDAAKSPGPFTAGGGQQRRKARKDGGETATTGLIDRILFNFPHVGGKSTDVNRQVRYNQELLVGFFRRALPSLAAGGSVVVTLFEGEPYTLWNIRDLGRHAGLQVERSFRFQAAAYPGYRHARTLGVVRDRHGEPGGGWKGEERPARSYVFVRKGDTLNPAPSSSKKRKRGDEDSSSDEDE